MIRPLFARVLLKRDVLKSTIVIPQAFQNRNAPARGIIVAVGPAVDESVKDLIGKAVLFGRFAGEWIRDGGDEVYVIQDEDILGVCDD